MINFPTGLDTLTNPQSTDKLDSVTVPHHEQHSNANDAIEALQVKVGINGSADTNSLDYKVADRVVKNANITAGTKTKVTYDAKGLVTGGDNLAENDIPSITVAAPAESSTQTTAGTRTIRSQFKILIDNIAKLFSGKVDKVTMTDNAIVRANGTGGNVQNSIVIIDDDGNVGIGSPSTNTNTIIRELVITSQDATGLSRSIFKNSTDTIKMEIGYNNYLGANLGVIGTMTSTPVILKTNNIEKIIGNLFLILIFEIPYIFFIR
jgi:hypothetical protein